MRILSIETSCDESAVSLLEAEGDITSARFTVLGNALLSQARIHAKYGGVFPSLAKREHAKALMPLLERVLIEASSVPTRPPIREVSAATLALLEREPELAEALRERLPSLPVPSLDAIAVTTGPGLEPALWVGINFARALSTAWNIPVVPVHHMEGHLLGGLLKETAPNAYELSEVSFPVLALLVSGGHTELILSEKPLSYRYLGRTRDDAAGEAFDKVARLLGLPYPGGPEISRLASEARASNLTLSEKLPRPMLSSESLDFSFAGLKTAVLYLLKRTPEAQQSEDWKRAVAREFEDAVAETLIGKTMRALQESAAKTLVAGGGVLANVEVRRMLAERLASELPDVMLKVPEAALTTDNALMIGVAGYFRAPNATSEDLRAEGTKRLPEQGPARE